MIKRLLTSVVLVASVFAPAAGAQEAFASECEYAPHGPSALTVGTVDCVRFDALDTLGAVSALSYYIPPSCDPALGRACPVLYHVHGTGGGYRSLMGSKGASPESSPLLKALAFGPPVNPDQVADPWRYGDPATWVALDPLDFIVVTPHGRTIPGGWGPRPNVDTAWLDWHPRYAKGGAQERYGTPAPQVRTYLLRDVIGYVDRYFPTVPEREWRASIGVSLGGFGSFGGGFERPDLFASIGAVSGAVNGPFPSADVVPETRAGVAPPAPVPYTATPGVTPMILPEAVWDQMYGAAIAVGAGDPATNQTWIRGQNAGDLVTNVGASAGGTQSLHIRYWVNDTVARRPEDFTDSGYLLNQLYEWLVFPLNVSMEAELERHDIEREFEIHPGLHGGVYRFTWFRQQLAAQYARVRHWDGSGSPPPRPVVFDYRTIRKDVGVWGWRFQIERDALEFLNLTGVGCGGLTLRGTGIVTVTVPASCHTGVDGNASFAVDLGPQQATDEPGGAGAASSYGRTAHVALTAL